MNPNVTRFVHMMSACFTGVIILALATIINAVTGSPYGVAAGFLGMSSGYLVAVMVADGIKTEREARFAAFGCIVTFASAVTAMASAALTV